MVSHKKQWDVSAAKKVHCAPSCTCCTSSGPSGVARLLRHCRGSQQPCGLISTNVLMCAQVKQHLPFGAHGVCVPGHWFICNGSASFVVCRVAQYSLSDLCLQFMGCDVYTPYAHEEWKPFQLQGDASNTILQRFEHPLKLRELRPDEV